MSAKPERFAHLKTIRKEVFKEARDSNLVTRGLSVESAAGIIAAQKAIVSRATAEELESIARANGQQSHAGYWHVRANMLSQIAKEYGAGYLLTTRKESKHD